MISTLRAIKTAVSWFEYLNPLKWLTEWREAKKLKLEVEDLEASASRREGRLITAVSLDDIRRYDPKAADLEARAVEMMRQLRERTDAFGLLVSDEREDVPDPTGTLSARRPPPLVQASAETVRTVLAGRIVSISETTKDGWMLSVKSELGDGSTVTSNLVLPQDPGRPAWVLFSIRT